jgi:hypothetical protein
LGGDALDTGGLAAGRGGGVVKHQKKLSDYQKPMHDDECGIRRNQYASALGALTMNQVMGPPKCDCGLAELLLKEPSHEA